MTIGQRINSKRKSIGMSAEDLAKGIGVSPATIYRYENGDIEKIPVDRLSAIAEALFTTTEELTGEVKYTTDELIDVHIRGAKKWADDFRFSEQHKTRLSEYMANYAQTLKQTVNAMANAVQPDGQVAPTEDVNNSISAMKTLSANALCIVNNDFASYENSPSEFVLTEGEKKLILLFRKLPADLQESYPVALEMTLKAQGLL